MAYTNEWSNIIPAGSANANLIDDHIRQLRLDVEERLSSFFSDIDDDPLVPIGLDKVVVGRAISLSIDNNSATTITWDTEYKDEGGMYDAGSPTVLTIQTAGYYFITGQVVWAATEDCTNGYLGINASGYNLPTVTCLPSSTINMYGQVSGFYEFSVSDTISMVVLQVNGAGDPINVISTTFLSAFRVF